MNIMKTFIKPEMKILPYVMNENIASSSGACSLGRNDSSGKQECQNCKLYYKKYNSLPFDIDISSAILTFSNTHGLGYADKTSAVNTANSLSCPEGRV